MKKTLLLLLTGLVLPISHTGCGTDPTAGDNLGGTGGSPSVPPGQADAGNAPSSVPDAAIETGPTPGAVQDIYITTAPAHKLDMVFMIDNSPSMAPKQAKMVAQFPKLLDALRDPQTGRLPDLRVAMIDSDLGTDGGYMSGSCGPNAANGMSVYGDTGNFKMINAAACGVTDQSLWLFENDGANPPSVNFTGGDIGKVFGCLATNLGTSGCGLEHQLQAFQWAFDAVDHPTTQVANFIRPDAFLGLVFLTDEDDCSGYRYDTQSNAPVQNGMFMSTLPGLSGESASLRCSTRAFTCSGRNLTVTPPGYPTTGAFHDLFKNCQPRTDFCDASVDTSQPTSCNPLADYVDIANSIKAVKNDDSKILVAGIFGYPKKGDMDTAPFIIDETPNPFAAPGTSSPTQTFDYWPVCFDAAHVPPAGTYTADAAGWGATGGLRNSAFVDQFSNGLKYSICESDFSAAMADIGMTILTKLQNLCIDYKLVDTDLTTAGIQADCHVTDQVPDGNSLGYIESPDSIPRCDQANGQLPCWQVTQDATKCSVGSTIPASVAGQLVDVQRPKGFVVAPGTIVKMQCRVCPETTAGVPVQDGCNYSP